MVYRKDAFCSLLATFPLISTQNQNICSIFSSNPCYTIPMNTIQYLPHANTPSPSRRHPPGDDLSYSRHVVVVQWRAVASSRLPAVTDNNWRHQPGFPPAPCRPSAPRSRVPAVAYGGNLVITPPMKPSSALPAHGQNHPCGYRHRLIKRRRCSRHRNPQLQFKTATMTNFEPICFSQKRDLTHLAFHLG